MQLQAYDMPRWRLTLKLQERMTAPVAKAHALSRVEMDVLCFLVNNPELDSARDIVEYRLIPKASVSQAVEQLIQKQLLTRQQSQHDRRQIHLKLTQEATSLAQRIVLIRQQMEDCAFQGFSQQEQQSFLQMSARMQRNLELKLQEIE